MIQRITDRPAYVFRPGRGPLLISMPHVGTYLPPAIASRLTPEARHVPDTDWHLERLYDFAETLGASVLVATHSRYVVDLNRSPDGASLYPGQSVTGLCPLDSFDDVPIYLAGEEPDAAEIALRRQAIWQPYHDALEEAIQGLHANHGKVVVWDAHSIRSVLPRFFTGKLPDLNVGTGGGISCAPAMENAVFECARMAAADGYTAVLNGRFTGGYITRHYGQPERNVHAIQLEMTQSSYMTEALPFDYVPERAACVQVHLRRMVEACLAFSGTQ